MSCSLFVTEVITSYKEISVIDFSIETLHFSKYYSFNAQYAVIQPSFLPSKYLFGLKMVGRSSLEKIFLKSLHAESIKILLLNL